MVLQSKELLITAFACLNASVLFMAQIIDVLTPDTWIISVMGAAGGLLGSLIRLILKKEKRREQQLSVLQEGAGAIIWSLFGAFTLLTAVMMRVYLAWVPPAVVFIPLCVYLPTAYVSVEKQVPSLLDRLTEALKVLVGVDVKNENGKD